MTDEKAGKTPRVDALDNEIKCSPPSDAPTPYRASEFESMAKLARALELENERLAAALQQFANLDKSVTSGLWAIRPELCEQARTLLAARKAAK